LADLGIDREELRARTRREAGTAARAAHAFFHAALDRLLR